MHCNKISISIGILNKLKHYIPLHIRINIYNSLILPYVNYGILLWGNNHEKVTKLQKKAMRIINLKKYNSHTEPLFQKLHMLKVEDIFKLHQLKFFYKFIKICQTTLNHFPFYETLQYITTVLEIKNYFINRE